jgi:hypothetical protein
MGWYSPFSSGHTTWRPAVLHVEDKRKKYYDDTREEKIKK